MGVTRLVLCAALGAVTAIGATTAVWAQGVPSETPPPSYTADQYVDSSGCVFVRVGVGGNVNWVPRVGRDRAPLCGYPPSLAGQAQTAAAPDDRAQEGVTVIGGATAAPRSPAAPAAAQSAVTVTGSPEARPTTLRSVGSQPRAVATTPRVVTTAPAVRTPRVAGGDICSDLPADLRPYFTDPNARCGPQAVHPGDTARGLGPVASDSGRSPEPRTVVRYVTAVPEGYRLAWSDDRLNPYRGLGTERGQRQMETVWTNTVPRQLSGSERRGTGALFQPASRPATLAPAVLVVTRANAGPAAGGADTTVVTTLSTRP